MEGDGPSHQPRQGGCSARLFGDTRAARVQSSDSARRVGHVLV